MDDNVQVEDTDTSTYTPYEMINFENGTLVTPASANLETGAVTMPVYSGRTPVNDTNLNHLEQGLKDLETYILTGGSVFGGNNPIGSISLWNTNTPPTGYLICDGTTYSKSQYPDLYDALGSDYQISAEQFKVPDFRGLVPIGAGTHQDTNSKSKTFTLGTEYGEYEHTQTINEMPLHNHTSENEQFSTALTPKTRINTGGTESGVANNPTGYTGGGQPFNVMQPSFAVNFIIKAIKSDTTLAEVENSLVSNSTVNAPSIYSVNEGINNINKNCINLGGTNNETKTITLTNGTLNDYRFLCVSSGWGTQKSTTTIPVSVFKLIGAGFEQCKQYVKTYNASAYTSIQYVNDTSFIINGAVGTDTVTDVYGIK